MFVNDRISDVIEIQNAPAIPGLIFRGFRGEADFPAMADALNASEAADGAERLVTVPALAHSYAHLLNCDLKTDFVMAEVDGQVVGYSRVEWWQNHAGERLYAHLAFLKPEWRRKGIGTAMLAWAQSRLQTIAAAHPADGPRYFEGFVADTASGAEALLLKQGYQAVRYALQMVRPDLENIPDFPLPAGLEVRPVSPEHYRLIWEADQEAFKDHWGYTPATEEDYQRWLADKVIFTPALWKIAWDAEKNEIAGQVRSFINHEENDAFKRRRGWTEFISTRRPWRKRGLARALIALSLRELDACGMTEAALGVDSQNLSGALRVYEDCGFRPVKRSTVYRKPLVVGAAR